MGKGAFVGGFCKLTAERGTGDGWVEPDLQRRRESASALLMGVRWWRVEDSAISFGQ
jgi:hypothetical protein